MESVDIHVEMYRMETESSFNFESLLFLVAIILYFLSVVLLSVMSQKVFFFFFPHALKFTQTRINKTCVFWLKFHQLDK